VATHRYISTTFWDDAWIQELNPSEKFVYLYLMTNPLTSISGVYKVTDRRISFDTGYDMETIKSIMGKFTAERKAIRFGEWIIIPTWPRHQNWEEKDEIKLGIISDLQDLPEEIFDFLNEVDYRFPLSDVKSTPIVRKLRKGISGSAWKQAIDRSGGKCVVCGSVKNIVVRHIIPVEEGGNNTAKNLEAVCHTCYTSKKTVPHPPMENETNPQTYVENDHNPQLLNSISLNSDSIPSEFNINFIGNSNDNPESPPCEQPVNNSPEKPPPNFYKIIKEKVKAAGYYIDEPVAHKIAKAIPSHAWFTQPHSIIDFVAEKIRDIYSEKPEAERKKLFISALISWENIQDEYPDWLNAKNRTDELRALERLKNTPPKICPHCGTEMESQRCPKCEGQVWFNDEKREWEYQERFEFSFEDFLKRKNQPPETKPPEMKPDDIDF
jgi:hypothetical protein